MPNRRTHFRQADVNRAAEGAIRAGLTVRVCHGDLQNRRAVSHRTLNWIGDRFQKEGALASA